MGCIDTPFPTIAPIPVENPTPEPVAPVESPTPEPVEAPASEPVETPTPEPVAPVETSTPEPETPEPTITPAETPTLEPVVIESQPCAGYSHCNPNTQYVNSTATCSGSPCDPTDADVCCIGDSAPASSDSGLSVGIIIVIVIAAVIFIGVISVAVYKVRAKGQTKGALIEM